MARPAKRVLARLLIHAMAGVNQDGGRLTAALRRCRAWAVKVARGGPPGQVQLQIADLQGRPFFTADALQRLIDVCLPAGTYHVTVQHDGQQRRYTVALEQGVTFNLHLRSTPTAR